MLAISPIALSKGHNQQVLSWICATYLTAKSLNDPDLGGTHLWTGHLGRIHAGFSAPTQVETHQEEEAGDVTGVLKKTNWNMNSKWYDFRCFYNTFFYNISQLWLKAKKKKKNVIGLNKKKNVIFLNPWTLSYCRTSCLKRSRIQSKHKALFENVMAA